MKIIHLIDPLAPVLLLRHEQLDASRLSSTHPVETWYVRHRSVVAGEKQIPIHELRRSLSNSGADLVHAYTPIPGLARALRSSSIPWISPERPARRRLPFFLTEPDPDRVRSPHPAFGDLDPLPEAVEQRYFEAERGPGIEPSVGWRHNPDSGALPEAVRARVSRVREDVSWQSFDEPPSPEELARIGVWADFGGPPTRDTFVPEALVTGAVVVAPRLPLNGQRLLGGGAGFLVPPEDPNEMAHVILNALFKPELARSRLQASLSSRDRFRPAVRASVLEKLYASLID